MTTPINPDAVKSQIREALINNKVNACPMAMRVAWHSSGTFDANNGTGGSDGGTMRFKQEATDPANAGLSIIRDMLHPVASANPTISSADLWTAAGAAAVEFLGGPKIKHEYCRTDTADMSKCPVNGLLPDASQGADHLREVFYRMGFNDQEIVVLSGAHTLGRGHFTRSGYDGPWTSTALSFNNEYFRNLMNLEWQPRKWKGKFQYEDVGTQKLMMLPTDMALRTDHVFRRYARLYANDEKRFFDDFAAAYAKLLALNTKSKSTVSNSKRDADSKEFREYSMHGSLEKVQNLTKGSDVHAVEDYSGRSALHKAAFWGHTDVVGYLLELGLDANAKDYNGDTPLHDAARFAHEGVVRALLASPSVDVTVVNNDQRTPLEVAKEYSASSVADKHDVIIALLSRTGESKSGGGGDKLLAPSAPLGPISRQPKCPYSRL